MKRLIWVLPVIALAACGGAYTLTPDEATKAELGAVKYSQAVNGKYVSCSGLDSNRDNYVTCTIEKDNATSEILCSYQAVGCKKK